MAELTYTVTVASGNLYGGGTGNVFYLDGARNSTGPGTVTWVNGGTLRFEQSDASNDGHPLIFSTTTSTYGIISQANGVAYYLDGSSSQANYTNTTTFNAATTRYVEITPSSSNDFYYLCYVHGIGMGGIFDIESNVWGGLSWGSSFWGNQGHIDVSVTGTPLTSTIGNETISANAIVSATGLELTSTIASAVAGTSALVSVTGSLESMAVGSTLVGIGALTTGSSITSNIGAATIDESTLTGEGWGRAQWGSFAWGVNFSVALTGQTLTSSIGEEAGFTDITVNVTGSSLTSTQGIISLVGDFGTIIFAAENQLNFTVGSVFGLQADANVTVSSAGSITSQQGNTVGGLKTPVDVTGIQFTSTIGTITLEQTTIEPVTGQQIAMSLGQHAEIPGQIIGVGGLQLSSNIGSVTITGTAGIDVTGIQLTASVGSPNITAWREIDPNVSNVWSEVDLAA